MKPITAEDWKNLENMIRDKVIEREVSLLEKSAEEIREHDDSKMAMIFNKVKEMPFIDANTLPHGTIVAFPELHCKEISMNRGIVIDDYIDFAGIIPKNIKIIVSQDCRMKILDNKDRFLCFKIDPQGFRIHARELDIILKDDIFFAFDGNKAMVPCVVKHVSERIIKPGGEVGYNDTPLAGPDESRKSTAFGKSGVKIYNLTPVYECTQAMSLFSDDGVDRTGGGIFDSYENIKLVNLKNAKFNEVPYNEFIKRKACELGITEMLAMGLAPHYDVCTQKSSNSKNRFKTEGNVVFCADENTKIIRIKGLIKDHMRNKEDLEYMANATWREFEVMIDDNDKSYNKAAFSENKEIEKGAGVEQMTQTTDLGGTPLMPESPMLSYWITGMDQSRKEACEEAINELQKIAELISDCGEEGLELNDKFFKKAEYDDEIYKIALNLKALPNQASRFKVMGSLKNFFEKKLDSHAHKLATNDWMKLKQKGFLSPDEQRVIKPFSHMGLQLKNRGFADVKENYRQMLAKDKSIGNSKFTKVASVDNEFFKIAGNNEYVEVRSVDKDRGTYSLKVNHVDKSKKIFKAVSREFRAIPYPEVREILKAIGFGNITVSEIMQRAKRDNYAKYELPVDSAPEKLTGGQVAGPVSTALTKVKNTIFDSNIGDAIAAEIAGAMVAGAILGGGAGSKPIYETVKKFASESENLSSAFEKIARENQSESILKVAKVMALSKFFNEKVAEVASGKAQYFKLNDVVSDIIEARPMLEKMASELIDLKVDQFKNGKIVVNPGYIQAAVKNIDRMFNVAVAINK